MPGEFGRVPTTPGVLGGGGAGRDVWGNTWDNSAITQGKTATDIANLQETGKQGRFNSAFGYLASQNPNQLGPWQAGNQPHISVGGVLNPQQIQAQVNQQNAGTDRSTATQNAQQGQQLAGRGFGSNSPLLQALTGANNMAGMQTKIGNETTARLGTAKENAGQVLASQSAVQNQYDAAQKNALQARGQSLNTYNALLSAISGLV